MKRHLRHALLLGMLALSAWLLFDHFNSLRIVEAKIVAITSSIENPAQQQLRVVVLSDFPESAFIPDRMRRFFYLQPKLCLVGKDGTPMLNDEVQSHCFFEDDEHASRAKKHVMEKSEFSIPFFLTATPYNGQRIFFNSMKRERGITVRLRLQGFILPPATESAPLFLSLEPYCKSSPQQCQQIFAW